MSWPFEVKKKGKMLSFDQKKTDQRWKAHCSMDFAEYLRKSDVPF